MVNIMDYRTDLGIDKNIEYKVIKTYNNKNIKILEYINNYLYHTIKFNVVNKKLKNIIKKELLYFFEYLNINKNNHILVVGLGNDSITADAVGPNTIKYITANSHIYNIIETSSYKVSVLEPSVLGKTGIDTLSIIKSITKLIKPDLIIFIDSFVTNDINNLNKTIIITNEGIIPGSGIRNNNSDLSYKTLKCKILSIGIPTALEISNYKNININLIMSTNNIDEYVNDISEMLGNSLNEVLYY